MNRYHVPPWRGDRWYYINSGYSADGSARRSGRRGREFESHYPDQMEVEKENPNKEREIERCGWCGESDYKEKVYASPGDDIENPQAYHKKCFEALQAFRILSWSNSDESMETLIKLANRIAGIKNKKKK